MKISVLTPSLNYGRFLRDCLESVALQRGVEIEHVVQDAMSSDETPEILASTPDVAWVSENDSGQADALNRALARATGNWIAWLNADEFYLPGALAALIETASGGHFDVVYGDTVFVDETGRFVRLMPHHPFHPAYLRWYGCYFASCSTIFKRDVLLQEKWDDRFRLTLDWDLYLRLVQRGATFGSVRFPAGAFRLHPAQVIAREHTFGEEFRILGARYGVRSSRQRALGRFVHDLHKLLSGAYGPQMRARRLKGRDLRWFASREGDQTARRLLSDAYGHTAPGEGER